jgi:acetyltransferase
VVYAAQAASDALATAKLVADVSQQSSKPVLAAWMGANRVRAGIQLLNQSGMATHSTPEQAVRAFMHLVSYARNLDALYETPRDMSVHFNLNRNNLRKRLSPVLKQRPGYLTEHQAKAFLRAYDIPVADSLVAHSATEAIGLAERIGYPVVLKVLSPQIVHKVDVGGVALDLENAEEVRAAYDRIHVNTAARRSDAEIKGVAVQKMLSVRRGHEVILGSKKDPTFGAIIMVGSGGVTTAVIQDRALGLPPLNERVARRMLESLRLWPLLQGFRGQPAVNVDRLIEVMIRFSCLITDYPEIQEFDINPLLVTPQDVTALDAVIVLDQAADEDRADPYRHLAIRPYPDEYIRHHELKDGTAVTLRPVKPEDEHMWHELIASASAQSIHYRFRAFFHKSTHEMAIQYCVIDYEREIAMVAETTSNGRTKLIGVAHLLADANHDTAEFAVIVADAWQGKGLGGKLLDHCVELAQRWGIDRIVAETHPRNRAMLATFRKRGFQANVCYEDEAVYLERSLAPSVASQP